jgi:hypothetical protein
MAQIICRQILDPNWEPQWGEGQANFLTDIDAVAQIIATRLKMFQGEWWASLTDGLPLWQQILGRGMGLRQQQAIVLLITTRITTTPFVTGISNVQASFDANMRSFSFSATVQTQFGSIAVSNQPTPVIPRLP